VKKEYKIEGMHCRSCEILLENQIKKIVGVNSVRASSKNGKIIVGYDKDVHNEVIRTIKENGYRIGHASLPLFMKGIDNYKELGLSILVVFSLIFLVTSFGLERYLNPALYSGTSTISFFFVGLAAGVSSCMALVGGLVLGLSARYVQAHPSATTIQKFRPHIFFNMGRIIIFFILGGLLAELGGLILLKAGWVGLLILFVSFVMIMLGISLTGISPKASTLISLPKNFSKFLNNGENMEYSHLNSFLLGGATFFLPCGFTQAVQIFAVSTGSFLSGGLVLFFFALGTTPGLLGVGGLTALIKKGFAARIFFKTVGVMIIIFAIYNASNALNLLGVRLPELKKTSDITSEESSENKFITPEIIDGVQVIESVYNPDNKDWQFVINPKDFVVKSGQPVRFEVLAEQEGSGCMGSITLPGLQGDFQVFEKNKKVVFEFTPEKPGTYYITCAMGVPMGSILVSS